MTDETEEVKTALKNSMTPIEPSSKDAARLIIAVKTTRLKTKPKRQLSIGKASSFPFLNSNLLVSSKITHLTKRYTVCTVFIRLN